MRIVQVQGGGAPRRASSKAAAALAERMFLACEARKPFVRKWFRGQSVRDVQAACETLIEGMSGDDAVYAACLDTVSPLLSDLTKEVQLLISWVMVARSQRRSLHDYKGRLVVIDAAFPGKRGVAPADKTIINVLRPWPKSLTMRAYRLADSNTSPDPEDARRAMFGGASGVVVDKDVFYSPIWCGPAEKCELAVPPSKRGARAVSLDLSHIAQMRSATRMLDAARWAVAADDAKRQLIGISSKTGIPLEDMLSAKPTFGDSGFAVLHCRQVLSRAAERYIGRESLIDVTLPRLYMGGRWKNRKDDEMDFADFAGRRFMGVDKLAEAGVSTQEAADELVNYDCTFVFDAETYYEELGGKDLPQVVIMAPEEPVSLLLRTPGVLFDLENTRKF